MHNLPTVAKLTKLTDKYQFVLFLWQCSLDADDFQSVLWYTAVTGTSCTAEWLNYTDMAANGAANILRPEYTTLASCRHGCKYQLPGCLAVQWRRVSSECFAVYDLNSIYGRLSSPGVDLYHLKYDCVTPREQR